MVDPEAHLAHDEADGEPDQDPADGAQQQLAGGLDERERSGDGGGDGRPVEDERRRVVDERLAFHDRDAAPRGAEPARDRRGRDRVGRRDDRAEDERRSPGEVRDVVRDDGDAGHGRRDDADRERRDRPDVPAQLPQRREERGRVEQRRQEADQDQVGRKLEPGQAGTKAIARPPSTSRIGNGMRSFGASASRPPITTISAVIWTSSFVVQLHALTIRRP